MSQNWKKFGGIKQLDALNHLTVNSLTTDELAIRKPYNGTFSVSGETFVFDNANFSKNVSISNDVYIDDNLYVRDKLIMGPQYERGSEYSNYLYSDVSGFGINQMHPRAVLDISGSHEHILNVYSGSSHTRNVLAQNKDGDHIAMDVDTSYARLIFSHSDASCAILYEPELDQLRLPERVVFGTRPNKEGTASVIAEEYFSLTKSITSVLRTLGSYSKSGFPISAAISLIASIATCIS